MINIEATIRWKGYDPNDLKPNSHKRVWATCERCGRGRWIQFRRADRSCFECSPAGGGTQTDEGKKILSDIHKGMTGDKNPNWKGGGIMKICPTCGNEFMSKHSTIEQREYCSKKCFIENTIGGLDIIQHHIIYDHSDLSKFTISLTRSAHTTLHNEYRKVDYRVPHINEVNIK